MGTPTPGILLKCSEITSRALSIARFRLDPLPEDHLVPVNLSIPSDRRYRYQKERGPLQHVSETPFPSVKTGGLRLCLPHSDHNIKSSGF